MFIILLLVFLILNPYTVIGPLAYYTALPLLYFSFHGGFKFYNKNTFLCFTILIAISVVGVVSSLFNGITQFEHLKVAVSMPIYYCIGIGLFVFFQKKIDINKFLTYVLVVGLINSLIILLQVQYPSFRSVVESFFVPSGNIDWTEGFRYRGLASGGGASLSVLSAFMIYIALYLYAIGKISLTIAITSIIILIGSVFFVGRTGVLLIGVVFLIFLIVNFHQKIKNVSYLLLVLPVVLFFGFPYIKDFLIYNYGESFYDYSLGLFIEGKDGLESEGTVGIIVEFMSHVPTEFPQILFGYGFYGGSEFYPWTDSGYARMFLSVGFIFGAIFYLCAMYIFKKSSEGKYGIFIPLIIILLVAETKEGLLFAGYSSRTLLLLMGFWVAQKINQKNIRTELL